MKFLEIFGKKKELFRKYGGLERFLNCSETYVFVFSIGFKLFGHNAELSEECINPRVVNASTV